MTWETTFLTCMRKAMFLKRKWPVNWVLYVWKNGAELDTVKSARLGIEKGCSKLILHIAYEYHLI